MEGEKFEPFPLIPKRQWKFLMAIDLAACRVWLDHLDNCLQGGNPVERLPEKWLGDTCLDIIVYYGYAQVRWAASGISSLAREIQMVDQLADDCVRIFAGLENMDFKRAAWSFMTSPDTCEPAFKKFRDASILTSKFRERCECIFCRRNLPLLCGCVIKELGNVLWQVSCYVPRNLSPSLPPPPYTLYAFNIELPPIPYPAATTQAFSVGRTLRIDKRRRSDSEDIEHIRKQRLLRFEGKYFTQLNDRDAIFGEKSSTPMVAYGPARQQGTRDWRILLDS